MLVVLGKIISIFLIIGLGYVLNKVNIIKTEDRRLLSDLLVDVFCPCMILATTTTREIDESTGGITLWSIGLSIFIFTLLQLMGLGISKGIGIKDKGESSLYAYAFMSTNSGFFGFPVSYAIFGGDVLFVFVMQNISLSFSMYLTGLFLLHLFSGKRGFDKGILINIVKNPCMIASVLSVIMLFSGIHFHDMILSSITLIGDATTPLSMLMVGVMLGSCSFKGLFGDRRFMSFCILKAIIPPVIVFLMLNWMPIAPVVKLGLVFAFTFPSAAMVAPIAEREGFDGELGASLIAVTTLFSVVTLSLTATFLSSFYGM